MKNLNWLLAWFFEQCDGNWEDGYGISLYTTERPGWKLFVRTLDTNLEEAPFINRRHGDKERFYKTSCYVEKGAFLGFCEPDALNELLGVFKNWSIQYSRLEHLADFCENGEEDALDWLTNWYESCLRQKISSFKRIDIGTLSNPGWALDVNLTDTNLVNLPFNKINLNNSDNDWLVCSKSNGVFSGNSGPFALIKMLKIFNEWASKAN